MIYAVLFMVLTGFLWAGVGMNMLSISKRNISTIDYYGLGTLAAALLSSLFFVRWTHVEWNDPRTWNMIIILIAGGVINAIAQVVIIDNFSRGPKAPIWAITQSSMIIPFLVGIIAFGEEFNILSVIGITSLILALAIFSLANPGNCSSIKPQTFLWFWIAVLSLFLVGSGQVIVGIPSHWDGFSDAGNLRTALVCFGSFLGMSANKIAKREPYRYNGIIFICIFAVLATLSYWLLFMSIDLFAEHGMTKAAFPIGVGTCIIVFSIANWIKDYKTFNIKEGIGVLFTICGVIMVSWPH